MVLDHKACDLIKPSATVNVVPHLDPEARVIVESSNGPVVQSNAGLRCFLKICADSWNAKKVGLRHDIDGGGTVFAVRKKHGRLREVWHGTKLSQASLPSPRPPCVAGTGNRSGISIFDWGFLVSCQIEMPLDILTGWPSQNTCAVSLDDLQSSRGEFARACNVHLFHFKRYLDTTGELKPDTTLYPCELPMAYGLLVEFTRCTIRPSEMLSERGIDAKTFFVH